MVDANVNINFNSKFDGTGAKQAADAVGTVGKQAKGAQAPVDTVKKSLGGLSTQASGLHTALAMAGKAVAALAIPAFVVGSVNAYINAVKGSTEVGNAWGLATDKLQDAYYGIGKTIASTVLPEVEALATATKAAAEWAAKYVIKPGLKAGGQLVTMGGALVGSIMEAVLPNFRKLVGEGGGAKLGLGIAGGITGSVLTPEQKAAQEEQRQQVTRAKLLEYYQLKRQADEQDIRNERAKFVLKRNFDKQEQYAIQDFQKSKMRAERDFNRQLLISTEDFQKSQYRAVRDFQRQEAITIEAYNRQRSIALRDFNISQARNEYDYQKQRARAQYDHNWSIRMAMLQGDAMAVWQANRQFKIEKQRAEEDFQLSKQRAKEDFERGQNDERISFEIERRNAAIQFQISQADAILDFTIQRKRTLEEFQISRKDQEIDFQIQRDRAKYQHNLQLQDMAYQYAEEARLRRQSFIDRHLPELIMERDIQVGLQRQIGTETISMFEKILAWVRSGGTTIPATSSSVPGHEVGGYTKRGLAMVHEGEFVMNRNTTGAAEKMAKTNRLTQQNVLEMMQGGGVSIVNNFSRGMAADEKFQMQQQFVQMAAGAFRK